MDDKPHALDKPLAGKIDLDADWDIDLEAALGLDGKPKNIDDREAMLKRVLPEMTPEADKE